jgi:3-hydroxybutyrate dehydrogenase|eukprot:gene7965-5731_t
MALRQLTGKLALVTGSTSGIGLGVAEALASHGANLVLNGFGNSQEIESLIKRISDQYKVSVDFQGADLSKYDEIEGMFNHINRKKHLDILVNNAGIQYVTPTENFPVEKWNQVININLNAVFYTTKLALPAMQKQNWGRIINIASAHGLVGSVHKSAYVASKHGVVGFTKVVALENAKTGVTANCICPGFVLTPLVSKQIEDRAKANGVTFETEKSNFLNEKQPSQEFVTPRELGELAAFLSTDAAKQVRGVAWNMDGGWVAQ